MKNKVAVGLLTYNRPEYYKRVLKSIPKEKIDCLLVINDGEKIYAKNYDADHVIWNQEKLGVAKSKNRILNFFIENDYDHIFIVEDDVIIKDSNVFQKYIETANVFGIHHLNFSKIADNEKTLRYSYSSPSGHAVGFYRNPQGAFSYFHKNLFKYTETFDENFLNAFEHIDLEYRLSKLKISPPFWYFPDILNSEKYLTTIEGSDEKSTITNKENYQTNWQRSAEFFVKKHGIFTNQIPDVSKHEFEASLMFLESNYSRKKLINGKKLSVIIPYRDREPALTRLIPELRKVLSKQVQNFEISVIEQDDDKPFNKGLLNNIGFLLSEESDYHCFHDVDLIPEISDYSFPENPSHISTFCSQFNYIENPDASMGGVVLFQKAHYLAVNGYPNDFVGWGKEDSALHGRCQKAGLKIYRHPFGRFYSVPHIHRLSSLEETELHKKNQKKWEAEMSDKTDYLKNGVLNLNIQDFSIEKIEKSDFMWYKIKNER